LAENKSVKSIERSCILTGQESMQNRIGTLIILLFAIALSSAPAGAYYNEACMDCHADEEMVRETEYLEGTSVFVDLEKIEMSMHAGMDCIDCHADASDDHPEQLDPPACADCHDETTEEYAASLHGLAQANGVEDAPSCTDCHGAHLILSADDPQSSIHPQKIIYTCTTCHANTDFIERRPVAFGSPLEGYQLSGHFKALLDGRHGATCTDCHTSHSLFKASDPRSTIHDQNIPTTCGQCHEEIKEVYEESIHGKALAFGNTDAPDCVDCHGEHEVRGPKDPDSPVYPSHISKTTCIWCHESERITKRYGLAAERMDTYADSYHGLADRSGSTIVANCASCHGIHNIRPSTDPQSTIHADNLPETCGNCHPGAENNQELGPIHSSPGNGEHPIVLFVRQLYILLILGTVGGMAFHNGLDFFKNFKKGRLAYGNDYVRFTQLERFQHAVMALSFIVLAYSGFGLKFPDEWWFAPFSWLGADEMTRRLIHRIAAVAMVGICIFHIGYLLLTSRGREQLVEMLPRLKDVRDFRQMMRHYLSKNAQAPAFARFSYAEKIEYWALVWGSAVMTLTGFALWFDNISLQFFPKWGLDVATTIHYYEAWLATLAIIIWHFYFVIFNPRVYPMSLVWLNGRMSEEEMAHEHPLELDKIRAKEAGENQDV